MSEQQTPTELLTVSQAAGFTGFSTHTLNRLRCQGGGPPFYKLGPKFVRYDRQDLTDWMRSARYTSTSEVSAA